MTQEWKEKLPDFVKRLEEALYQGAGSKVSCVSSLDAYSANKQVLTTNGGAGRVCQHKHSRTAIAECCSHICLVARPATSFATTTVKAGLGRVVSTDTPYQRFHGK